jgi:integrase
MQRVPTVSIYQPTVKKKDVRVVSKVWWLRWWQDGRDRRESSGTRNKREALRRAQLKQSELERGEKAIRNVSWSQAKTEFLKDMASVKRAATHDAYNWSLKTFERLVKPDGLTEIDAGVLGKFAAARNAEKVVPETVNKDLRAVRRFLNWSVEQHYLRITPTFKQAFVREDEKLPVVIPRAEYEAMLAMLDSGTVKLTERPAAWYKVFTQLGYQLGLRKGEILGLAWQSVDLEKMELVVQSKTSKSRRCRVLPFDRELAESLRAWREVACPGEKLVLPFTGSRRGFYSDWHRFAGDRVPKNCRSSTGSQMVAAGTPTAIVKDWLGHSSIAITEKHYVNTSGTLRAAAEARKAAN